MRRKRLIRCGGGKRQSALIGSAAKWVQSRMHTETETELIPQPDDAPCDCHFHVFDANRGKPDARYVPAYAARLVDWQAAASSVGVRRGVLVQTSFMGTDNTLLLAQLAAEPDALRGVAIVAPDMSADALHPLHVAGVRAIRLNLAGTDHSLAAWSDAAPLWDALLALGWHVEVHTGSGRLPEVLRQLPESLPLVIDHMAMPQAVSTHDPTVQALRSRTRSAAVHVKLSGAYRLGGCDAGALARLWLAELGPQRLLWGSDWPCTNHEAKADYVALHAALHDWLGGDARAVQAALVGNPARLYWRK